MTKNVTGLRPGGRSARIQEAVHCAVLALQQELEQSQITVPMIAMRAGVTPSTIYRRWGDIQQLFSDVAFSKLQPDSLPRDLGSFREDLYAWVEQYYEEYSSSVGRALLKDVLAAQDTQTAERCYDLVSQQLDVIRERAIQRNENFIENRLIIEIVVAPLIYMILFSSQQLDLDFVHKLLIRLFEDQ
ncbi:TetR/AcrR family transcriptional regulator [Acinetobacter stercoris]|uniref:HTH tetR-type domain-containing protein n=1 Tax=Acinetobacter stercoris TaxID=2126983 RepID=A0A2U3MY26_9GAMM|nr:MULTISPECIES: TetR/AcrR family transcriptional regulator [Acinetobacter]SPL70209.1 hypothetical protein KPC_1387 [Acinetobacter stercoris]